MPKPGLQKAIPLGKGRGTKEIYFFDLGDLLHFDRKGEPIDPFNEGGNYVDPKTLSEYDHSEIVPFQAGVPQLLPYWDDDLLREFVEREEFARPGLQEKIDGWIEEGIESHDLIDLVRKEGGLITLTDVGLSPLKEETNPQEESPTGG
jgi:hypothetical protein